MCSNDSHPPTLLDAKMELLLLLCAASMQCLLCVSVPCCHYILLCGGVLWVCNVVTSWPYVVRHRKRAVGQSRDFVGLGVYCP